ncbi:MAG TPA: head GIN domain-containing protein [Hanamia sp.]
MNQSKSKYIFLLIIIFLAQVSFAQTTTNVKPFTKVTISPNIQVTFIQGDKESVTIEHSTVSKDSIHIEVNDNILRIYLQGQKELPKNETTHQNGHKEKKSVYEGTVVTATVTYKTLNDLSIRGEETQLCKSMLTGDNFKLKIYGESHVIFDQVNLGKLQTTLYGEGSLETKSGTIKDQRFIAYGEGQVKNFAIKSNTAKITAYGEADFQINASESIRITSYGEAKLEYKGNAVINKGLNIGNVKIIKLD